MSEEDIKALSAEELKEFITENVIKVASLKKAKRDYNKSIGDLIKKVDGETSLAMDVLEGKDSELARRIMVETHSLLEQRK